MTEMTEPTDQDRRYVERVSQWIWDSTLRVIDEVREVPSRERLASIQAKMECVKLILESILEG